MGQDWGGEDEGRKGRITGKTRVLDGRSGVRVGWELTRSRDLREKGVCKSRPTFGGEAKAFPSPP